MLNSFEGDESTKRTRLDHLGSQFENLRWSDNDSVASFSAKLSVMAHEAFVLGKKYKEKKLVKKLLRCSNKVWSSQGGFADDYKHG